MRRRTVLDVSGLPDYGFGTRMTMWWGTLGFIALEGMGFALAAAVYVYLAWLSHDWPLGVGPPDLLWPSVFTAVAVASLLPNALAKRAATGQHLRATRIWLVVMSVVGVLLVALRGLEFTGLHVRWDTNAYGSALWFILGLHTLHLVTDLGDTLVLTVLMFTRHGHGKRFSDVEDNAFYWTFVVASWVPIYLLLDWGPRM